MPEAKIGKFSEVDYSSSQASELDCEEFNQIFHVPPPGSKPCNRCYYYEIKLLKQRKKAKKLPK
jgi:hypothetical protein